MLFIKLIDRFVKIYLTLPLWHLRHLWLYIIGIMRQVAWQNSKAT